jgi:hypothetical protein
MHMRKLISAAALGALAMLATHAWAAVIYQDSFNYDATGNPTLAPTTTSSPYNLASNGGTACPKLNSPGLTYSQGSTVLQTSGNDVVYDCSGTPTGVAMHDLGTTISSGSIYYSLLFKVTQVTASGGNGYTVTGVNNVNGSFVFGFEQTTTNTTNNPQVGAPLLIRSGDGTQTSSTFQLGTGVNAGTSPQARMWEGAQGVAPNHPSADTVYFLVGKYTFNAGATNDEADLWINPALDSLEAANVPAVAALATPANGIVDLPSIQSFFLRNNSVAPDTIEVDEVRIGTAWEDVTSSVVPEPSALCLLAGLAGAGLAAARRRRRRG